MKTDQFIAMLILICIASFTSCKKEETDPSTPPPPSPTASISFLNLTFNTTNAYFSSDGSMTAPVAANQAKTVINKIDITFIYNYDYWEPGFFDPIARSQVWYWDDYYEPWLSAGVETRYYSTTLTKTDFDAAKDDESKIAAYFSNSTTVLAPNPIFPEGSCIGGRQSTTDQIALKKGLVCGFKNTSSGKRGLLYIRTDQESGWPAPLLNFNTKVDIIRDN